MYQPEAGALDDASLGADAAALGESLRVRFLDNARATRIASKLRAARRKGEVAVADGTARPGRQHQRSQGQGGLPDGASPRGRRGVEQGMRGKGCQELERSCSLRRRN
jgi:hypothetical protein